MQFVLYTNSCKLRIPLSARRHSNFRSLHASELQNIQRSHGHTLLQTPVTRNQLVQSHLQELQWRYAHAPSDSRPRASLTRPIARAYRNFVVSKHSHSDDDFRRTQNGWRGGCAMQGKGRRPVTFLSCSPFGSHLALHLQPRSGWHCPSGDIHPSTHPSILAAFGPPTPFYIHSKGLFRLGTRAIGERRSICPMWHAHGPPRPLIRK